MYKRGIHGPICRQRFLGWLTVALAARPVSTITRQKSHGAFCRSTADRSLLPFLETLPRREIIAGYGEALRLHATVAPASLGNSRPTLTML